MKLTVDSRWGQAGVQSSEEVLSSGHYSSDHRDRTGYYQGQLRKARNALLLLILILFIPRRVDPCTFDYGKKKKTSKKKPIKHDVYLNTFLSIRYSIVNSTYDVVQISRTLYSSFRTEALYPLKLPISFAHYPQATTILLSVPLNLTTLDTSCKWNHRVFVFSVSGLFH